MSETLLEQPHGGEVPDGAARVDVRLERETVWLTRHQMADVFDTTPPRM